MNPVGFSVKSAFGTSQAVPLLPRFSLLMAIELVNRHVYVSNSAGSIVFSWTRRAMEASRWSAQTN